MTNKIFYSQRPSATTSLAPAALSLDWRLMVFVALHIPLAYIARSNTNVSTLHALLTLAVGVGISLRSKTPLVHVACAGAYIVGAEVFWRMTNARIFWEYGKYALCLVLLVALVRTRLLKIPSIPLIYFLLLLPAATVTFTAFDLNVMRQALSTNLSGPLSILVSAWFFSNVKLSRTDFQQIFLIFLASTTAVAFIVFYSSFLGGDIGWGSQSNFQATGGFGPNQVSDTLGQAGLAAWLLAIYAKKSLPTRLTLVMICVGMMTLAVLTFSRGGVYTALAAGLFTVAIELTRGKQKKGAVLFPLVVAILLSAVIILPKIDELTGGAAQSRFTNGSLTGRDTIIEDDIQVFRENIATGVGVGLSPSYRQELSGDIHVSHTEYTRLLSEHGLLGVLAIGMLMLMIWRNARRNWQSPTALSISISGVIWALIIMFHSAMRLAAPGFMFGFSFAQFDMDEAQPATDYFQRYRRV